MKNYTILVLAVIAIFSFKINAAIYTVSGGYSSSNLGIETIPVAINGLDDSFDDVLFTFEPENTSTTITNMMLDLGGVDWLGGATLIFFLAQPL
jgi:hypothetical protein